MIFEVLAWLSFLVIGIRLSCIDLAEHRLPNRLVIALAVCSNTLLAGASISSADPARFLRAMACGVLVFSSMLVLAVFAPTGLGMGDVKLGFVTGLFLGWIGWEWAYWGTFIGFATEKADNTGTGHAASAIDVKLRSEGFVELLVVGATSAADEGERSTPPMTTHLP